MGARDMLYNLRRQRLYEEGHVSRPPDLEDLEHEQRERERLEGYVVALRRERMGVEVELARLRQLRPESRQWAPGDDPARGEPPTAAKRVAAAEGRIEVIDREIERVGGRAWGAGPSVSSGTGASRGRATLVQLLALCCSAG